MNRKFSFRKVGFDPTVFVSALELHYQLRFFIITYENQTQKLVRTILNSKELLKGLYYIIEKCIYNVLEEKQERRLALFYLKFHVHAIIRQTIILESQSPFLFLFYFSYLVTSKYSVNIYVII